MRRLFGRLDFLAFAAAVFFLAFAGGAAVVVFQVFPYQQIMALKLGWDALWKLESAKLPANTLYIYPEPEPVLTAKVLDPAAGSEQILIAGGFWQNMDRCPTFGCVAWVTDRQGNIGHAWETDPAPIIAQVKVDSGPVTDLSIYVTGVALTPDGGLVMVLQGRNTFPYQIGIAKIGFDGTLEWMRGDYSHHWPTVDADGTIIVPSVRMIPTGEFFGSTVVEAECVEGQLRSEGVRVLNPDGSPRAEFWFDDILAAADYPGLNYARRDGCNPYHVNGIAVVTPAAAARMPGTKVGDLAVSLREASAVLVIDRETGVLRHAVHGRFAAQHSPGFLADGSLVVFDNRGGQAEHGGSRIVAVDPATGASRTVFPTGDEGDAVLPFISRAAGVLAINADASRILISESQKGRVFEVDVATSTPLWLFEKTLNIRPFLDLRGESARSDTARYSTQGAYFIDPANPAAGQ